MWRASLARDLRLRLEQPSDRAARDLLWAINSPSLLAGDLAGSVAPIHVDDIPSAALRSDLARASVPRRVGHYFERLVYFYLTRVRACAIVGHRQQITENGRTVGELDFLFRDEFESLHHWEVAVKFFLYYPPDNPSGSHFVGPNPQDNLERKAHRLRTHQLPLGRIHFAEIEHQAAFVKGMVFYHPQDVGPTRQPIELSPEHLRGAWIREVRAWATGHGQHDASICHIAQTLLAGSRTCVRTQQQYRNQVPTRLILRFPSCSRQLGLHFARWTTPVMLSQLAPAGDVWTENQRLIVVSDGWPRTQSARKHD